MTLPPRPAVPGFRLVRYFTVASLAAFVLVAAALLYFGRREGDFFKQVQQEQNAFFAQVQDGFAKAQNETARRDLLTVYEAGNVNLGRLFSNALWEKDFGPFVAKVQRIPIDQCRAIADVKDAGGKTVQPSEKKACSAEIGRKIMAYPEFQALDAKVFDTMKKSTVFKIKVFDQRGITAYSSEHNQIGEDRIDNAGWKSAMAGKPASQLTFRGRFSTFEGEVENRDLISSYLPVLAPGSEKIVGVFEVYSDVTPFVKQINATSAQIGKLNVDNQAQVKRAAAANQDKLDERANLLLAIVLGLLALLYCALYLIVRHGQRVIDKEKAERERAEEGLSASASRYRAVAETASDAIIIADGAGTIVGWNPAAGRMFGHTEAEVIGQPLTLLMPHRYRDRHLDGIQRIQAGGERHVIGKSVELHGLTKAGSEFPFEVALSEWETPEGRFFAGIIHDLTARKKNEQRIARLSRIQAVMSAINSLIVRVRDRQELFNGACRIAVEQGGFGIAWIGVLNQETLEITPAACAGVDADSLLAHSPNTARPDTPLGQGGAGRAIREKRAVFSNDITTEPGVGGERRKEAIRRGYRSLIVLPLLVEDAAVGILALFAQEADFFTTDELKLLNELAGDISFALDHIAKEEKLNYLAYYDALTGLPNRALFNNRLAHHLRAASHEKNKTALVLIDLERFRVINDTLGRSAADDLLKLVAERLQSVIFDRDSLARVKGVIFDRDSLARVQGDIFVGLFPGIKDEADIARLIEEKIIGCLNQPFTIAGQELRVSAKIGVALYPGDATEPDALFSAAEAALRQTKGSSDRYLFYAPRMNAFVAERLKLENKLQRALEQEQFVLFYQPKVDLNTGRVAGLEALIRWNDPDGGLVMPMRFIPLLEETGMIVEVGAWAMKQAVTQYAAWQAAGLQPPPIAVNVSQVQLKRKDFVTSVQQAIAIAGKPDHGLVLEHGLDLEITESMIMEDVESSIEKLKTIRELGVGIAIDDFGTGYSSLRYLARLPITALKIDRAFVQHMATNPSDMAIVSTIIGLARTLNLKVIAEGVETEEQSKFLRLLKCDEMQGYLFSKPVPAEQVPALLAKR